MKNFIVHREASQLTTEELLDQYDRAMWDRAEARDPDASNRALEAKNAIRKEIERRLNSVPA